MTRMKWFGILAGGAVLLGTALWAFRSTPDVQVEWARVTSGPVTRLVLATGTVQAATTVAVGAQVSGVVQSLDVDFNAVVHAGQIVARLDPSTYDAQLREARATLAQEEADALGLQTAADDAQVKLTRAEGLAAQQIITASDLEDARATMDEASAALHAGRAVIVEARAAVAQASDDLDHTIIRSPIDGIVTERDVDVGQTLTATVQAPLLFMIASDLRHLQVVVQVDESDVAGLAEGEPATLEVASYPDETFHGVLAQLRLNPIAEQTTGATSSVGSTSVTSQVATVVGYPAIVNVDNPDERLRPGMTAEVTMVKAQRAQAIRIPNGALTFRPPPDTLETLHETESAPASHTAHGSDPGTSWGEVWTFDGTRFTPVEVHVGLSDERWTEVLGDSVHAGDELVTRAAVVQRSRM